MIAGTDVERIADLEADNRRLRRLLDQQDAPGELRHRLYNTLALLRAVVRKSADTGRELPDYVAQLEDRLEAVVHAQGLADQHGEVDLHTLLSDELFHYQVLEGERAFLSGPDVSLQPSAGQTFALAIHELAINAVEHGTLGTGIGQVDVSWNVVPGDPNPLLLFTWKETALPPGTEPTHTGFGTEMLTRMLPYNLSADTKIVHEVDGLLCTIHFPLYKHIGRAASTE